MVDKIVAVPVSKVGQQIGELSTDDLTRLEEALIVFLGLGAHQAS
jgi:mRNA-degrading endonuclease toxin of MazEF toxin-antitoxin module